MADTFVTASSTINFTAIVANPGRDRRADINYMHIPGGSMVYIDVGGPQLPTVNMDLLFAASTSYMSMEKSVGGRGVLTFADGAASAILESLSRKTRLPSGATIATANFVLLE